MIKKNYWALLQNELFVGTSHTPKFIFYFSFLIEKINKNWHFHFENNDEICFHSIQNLNKFEKSNI